MGPLDWVVCLTTISFFDNKRYSNAAENKPLLVLGLVNKPITLVMVANESVVNIILV